MSGPTPLDANSTTATATEAKTLAAPSIGRRMACFLYEGVLLFGLLMVAGLAYGIAYGQRNAMLGRSGLQGVLFVVLGVYFVWLWSHGGQTLAMKTWRIRLVGKSGNPASIGRCALRYFLAWAWFAPALLALWLTGARDAWAIASALAIGVTGYGALALLTPGHQFWHDIACGTRLVSWAPVRAGGVRS